MHRTIMTTNVLTLPLVLAVVGCSGGRSGASGSSAATTEAPATQACTTAGVCPAALADLETLSGADISSLFDQGTTGDSVLSGDYDGLPLCFPDQIPPPEGFPVGARAIPGFDALVTAMGALTQDQLNTLAGFLWHGKRITASTSESVSQLLQENSNGLIFIANVVNNIGRPGVDFSAEANLYIDRPHNSLDLDYSVAQTALMLPGDVQIPGISGISLAIVQQIWDRVRLVNPSSQLYIGTAYIVNQPGVYDSTAVPLCNFALTPKGAAAGDDAGGE